MIDGSEVVRRISSAVIKEAEEAKKVSSTVDLQPTVNAWLAGFSGDAGVLIYDLDNDSVVAEHQPNKKFSTASLYKLFVVYEGYKRVMSGEWSLDSYGKCLDLAIRESNSACAEKMWAQIGRAELDKIVRDDFGILDTKVSALTSTPADIAEMMKLYYRGDGFSEEIREKIFDSLLNQPVTKYDWRRGLPAGFTSGKAKVYDKVGWEAANGYWRLYHDAAIVEIEERNYIVVVMTTNAKSHREIAKFGAMLEAALLDTSA